MIVVAIKSSQSNGQVLCPFDRLIYQSLSCTLIHSKIHQWSLINFTALIISITEHTHISDNVGDHQWTTRVFSSSHSGANTHSEYRTDFCVKFNIRCVTYLHRIGCFWIRSCDKFGQFYFSQLNECSTRIFDKINIDFSTTNAPQSSFDSTTQSIISWSHSFLFIVHSRYKTHTQNNFFSRKSMKISICEQ